MQLRSAEREILRQTQFFELKRSAMHKLEKELDQLREHIKISSVFQSFDFPKPMDIQSGKISKGENYLGLPYLILDFPRLFSKHDIFAFRTMFWWGHGCYFTVHLSGISLELLKPNLLHQFSLLTTTDTYISVGEDEWQHHITPSAFQHISTYTLQNWKSHLSDITFLKFVHFSPLDNIDSLAKNGLQYFDTIFKIL